MSFACSLSIVLCNVNKLVWFPTLGIRFSKELGNCQWKRYCRAQQRNQCNRMWFRHKLLVIISKIKCQSIFIPIQSVRVVAFVITDNKIKLSDFSGPGKLLKFRQEFLNCANSLFSGIFFRKSFQLVNIIWIQSQATSERSLLELPKIYTIDYFAQF